MYPPCPLDLIKARLRFGIIQSEKIVNLILSLNTILVKIIHKEAVVGGCNCKTILASSSKLIDNQRVSKALIDHDIVDAH